MGQPAKRPMGQSRRHTPPRSTSGMLPVRRNEGSRTMAHHAEKVASVLLDWVAVSYAHQLIKYKTLKISNLLVAERAILFKHIHTSAVSTHQSLGHWPFEWVASLSQGYSSRRKGSAVLETKLASFGFCGNLRQSVKSCTNPS